jgi:hypothetical protein
MRTKRRGVLLLVILALLAMFAMVAVAFVVITRHDWRGAKLAQQVDQVADPPDRQLDQAMRVIVRGTNDPGSAVHIGLLEGIYGHETLGAHELGMRQPLAMGNPQPVAGGQLFEFPAPAAQPPMYPDAVHRIGCVLTMLDGPAAGMSTRIVGIDPPNLAGVTQQNPGNMQAMVFEGGVMPQPGNHYIINDLAYNGMGLGYNPASGALDAKDTATGKPLALMPFSADNWAGANADPINPATWGPKGGANVGYTAPDNQTMLLAYQVPMPGGGVLTPLPSLHRPELIKFVGNGAVPTDAATLREVMARPNQYDHPNFPGNNPNAPPLFDPINGPWDVDNLGMGVPDSIWVDLGFPARQRADGKWYKPLIAVLCIDLDGRLNLNAHGMWEQANTAANTYYVDSTCSSLAVPNPASEVALGALNGAVVLALPNPVPSGSPQYALPRGLGYGPPEVNLMPLFQANPNTYNTLLVGNGTLNGRYGELGYVTGTNSPMPGYANGGLWPDTYNRWWDYQGADPNDQNHTYWYYRSKPGSFWWDAYGSPPDPQGYGAVALDVAGRPLYMSLGGSCWNTPYDMNLSLNAPCAVDNAPANDKFGPAELEAALRPFDSDAPTLPKRLAVLTSTDGTPGNSVLINPPSPSMRAMRFLVTTEQSSVPTPSLAASPTSKPMALNGSSTWPAAMGTAGIDRPRHIVDYLRAMGIQQQYWPALLPPEMLAGLKLDLNRPLYNWRANSSAAGFQLYSKPGSLAGSNSSFTLDPMGQSLQSDPTLANPAWQEYVLARQRQARYLYVLARLFCEQNQTASLQAFSETGLTPAQQQQLTQRRLAQWAINAVCFSTDDSVMVPFKYPLPGGGASGNPGWPLQDNLIDSTSKDAAGSFGVVWGCKPPECLLNEAAAGHDRRVADTGFDAGSVQGGSTPGGKGARRLDQDPNDHNYWKFMDQTLDQVRVPQGWAFIELFCPRSPRLTAAPQDLYYLTTPLGSSEPKWCLDLGLLAGATPGKGGGGQASQDGFIYPVWRIVISESRMAYPDGRDNVGAPAPLGTPASPGGPTDPGAGRLYQHPDSSSLEPEQVHDPAAQKTYSLPAGGVFSLLPNNTGDLNVTIERIVWLAPQPPSQNTTLDAGLIYYNRTTAQGSPVPLPGGQYAVVGPRATTYIGSTGTTTVGPPAPTATPAALGTASPQKIVLSPTAPTVSIVGTDGQNVYPAANIQAPLGLVVAGGGSGSGTNWPTDWKTPAQTCPNGIGLSISEPLFSGSSANNNSYYPEPNVNAKQAPSSGSIVEWYGDYDYSGTNYFPDLPLESPANTDKSAANYPIVKDKIIATQTVPYYKTVFLQRLANPSAAYHPVNNPYRTVDWMPIDLTVFNGDDRVTQSDWQTAIANAMAANGDKGPQLDPGTPWDQDDPKYNNSNEAAKTHFWSRQRGSQLATDQHYLGNTAWNVWAQVSDNIANMPSKQGKTTDNSNPPQTIHFQCDLQHSLGYINSPFWTNAPALGTPIYPPPAQPGWMTTPLAYLGDPGPSPGPGQQYVFPWITWNGRPYVSELELLLVPASHPGRLLWEFSFVNTSAAQPNPYTDPGGANPPQSVAYNHLLDFFQSQSPPGTGGQAVELHRLLEFVGVPSRFPCAQTQINPNFAAGNVGAHWFHPPFNRVPNYRDFGRINLNTIPSIEVFQGLLDYYPGMGDANSIQGFWPRFIQSRHGAANGNPGDDFAVPNAPSRFAGAFRSPGSAAMAAALSGLPREVEAGLLRSDPTDSTRPLFQTDATTTPKLQMCADYNRNAFFRYQGLERLGNLVTTRSNVFAVWITVGYFEVTPAQGPQYPDGWQLGQELGTDTGQIDRHRAFYIFDRSIPVGFIRGYDINQDKALLLRRFIE